MFLCSCATVNTRVDERIVARGELVSSATTRHPASDLLRLHASSCRNQLTITGTVLKACRRSAQQRVAVDRDIVREAPATKYEAIAAALLVGGGALLAWQTAYGCDDSNPPKCSGSESLSWTGIGMAYAGVGLGLASVIDAQRSRDTKERVQTIETTSMLEWCGEEPARGRGVSAIVAGSAPVSGRFDDTGAVSLTVHAPVPIMAISIDGAPAISTPVREMCSRSVARARPHVTES